MTNLDEKINELETKNKCLIIEMREVYKNMYRNEEATEIWRELYKKSALIREEIEQLETEKRKLKIPEIDNRTEYAKQIEQKRAEKELTVTCSTYERAKKRMEKEVNGFLCRRY